MACLKKLNSDITFDCANFVLTGGTGEIDEAIVIKPIKSKISLEQLLADITSDNLHGEVDTGHAVGKEFY